APAGSPSPTASRTTPSCTPSRAARSSAPQMARSPAATTPSSVSCSAIAGRSRGPCSAPRPSFCSTPPRRPTVAERLTDLLAEGHAKLAAAVAEDQQPVVLHAEGDTDATTDLLVWSGNNLPAL